MLPPPLKLAFNINFSDLYTVEGLNKLDQIFISYVAEKAPHLDIFKKAFKSKKRINCAPPAPAYGLYLIKIKY